MTDVLDILNQASDTPQQGSTPQTGSPAVMPNAPDVLDILNDAHSEMQTGPEGNDQGGVPSFIYGLNSTVPFGNRLTSAAAAAVDYPIAKLKGSSISYGDLYKQAQADSEATTEAHPVANLGGVASGIVETLPLGIGRSIVGPIPTTGVRGAINAIPAAVQSVGNFVKGGALASDAGLAAKAANFGLQTLRSAGVQGAAGALYGAGASENMGEGALAGGAIGAIGGAALHGAGTVIAGIYDKLIPSEQQAALRQFKDKAEKYFGSLLANRPDLQQSIDNATTLGQAADALGIDMTTAEKLAFNNVDPLMKQQAVLAGNPVTGAKMAQMYQNRSGQIENAYTNIADKLHPGGTYDSAAQDVISAAQKGAANITKGLTEKASPIYEEALSKSVPASKNLAGNSAAGGSYSSRTSLNDVDQLIKSDPVANAYINKALSTSEPSLAKQVYGKDKNSIATLDAAKKLIDRDLNAYGVDAPANPGALKATKQAIIDIADKHSLDENGNSLYAAARNVYSSQPEQLAMRERMGSAAAIDANNPAKVANNLMSGTQKTAQLAADALGPEGRNAAGAAIIRNAVETNRGAPETIVNKLSPNDRASEQLAAYAGDQAGPLQDLAQIAQKVNAGNKLIHGSQTQPLTQASESLKAGADLAKDIVTGNKIGVVKKLVSMISGNKAEDPAYLESMRKLIATPRGMQVAQQVADALKTAGVKNTPLHITVGRIPASYVAGMSAKSMVNK